MTDVIIVTPNAIDRTDMMEARVFTTPDGAALPYRLYVPQAYDAAQNWPLVLYLHGAGERGDDNRAHTSKNSVMQTLFKEKNLRKYPCVVLAPQCPEDDWWTARTEDLMGLLEHAKAEYSIDDARVYITGISMGGYGTWAMLAAYPDYFAAAVPVCGAGDPQTAALFKDNPIWAFHGGKDSTVPPEGSRDMVAALEVADAADVRYTEYPRLGHVSWERAYRERDLFAWLFAQSRDDAVEHFLPVF